MYTIILFFIALCCTAQSNEKVHLTDIQQIDITNTRVHSIIKEFIVEQKIKNPLFKEGYGYTILENIDFKDYKTLKYDEEGLVYKKDSTYVNDPLIVFDIVLGSYLINGSAESNCFNCDYYPPFFTYIDNTLVLIYDKTYKWLFSTNGDTFSSQSKNELTQRIRARLIRSLQEDFEFYDPFKKKYFLLSKKERQKMSNDEIMVSGAFTIKGGKRVHILRNGDVKFKNFD